MIAVLASLGILGLGATAFAQVLMPFFLHDSDKNSAASQAKTPPSSTVAELIVHPLEIRPVLEQPLVAQPGECPVPPTPPPPTDPMVACNLENNARFQLGPVGLRLNLTGVTSAKVDLTEFYGVQLAMDTDSGNAFAAYTGANLNKQIAFMRDGVVLASPKIGAPITGNSIQLSGDMTAETAETIVRMVREGA
jgi:hypothetical protein